MDKDIELTKLIVDARDKLQRADALLSAAEKPALSRVQGRMLCAALDECLTYAQSSQRKMPVTL